MRIAGYSTHPIADLFPLMSDEEMAGLVENIREHGLRHPVVLLNETVLDGRNRLIACERAGIEAQFVAFDGADPVAFVLSENLHRRHLSASQRGMIGARIADLPKGNPELPNASKDAFGKPGTTQAQAAAALGVSRPTIQRAREVLATGVPALIEAVDQGKVSVAAGARIAKLEPGDQAARLSGSREEGEGGLRNETGNRSKSDDKPGSPEPPTKRSAIRAHARDVDAQVAALTAEGVATKSIAQRLGITANKVHVSRRRSGLTKGGHPIDGITERATKIAFDFGLYPGTALYTDGASAKSREAAVAALKDAARSIRKVINWLNNAEED